MITRAPFNSTGNLEHYPSRDAQYRAVEPFTAVLSFGGYRRGRSAAYFEWRDVDSDRTYPMFLTDLSDLIDSGASIESGLTERATWVVCKRGQNYGVRLAKGTELGGGDEVIEVNPDGPPAPPKSFLERQRDAALEEIREIREIYAERRRVADIVIGTDHRERRGRSIAEMVRLESDYVVAVSGDTPAGAPWTVVQSGKATSWYFHTQEEAVLFLFSLRHSEGDFTAAYYAARVLGIPWSDK